MTIAHTYSAAVIGAEGHLIDVEAYTGHVDLSIIGLPDAAARATRHRVRAAIDSSGVHWLARGVNVSLSPVSIPKRPTSHDLAIAVASLTVAGVVRTHVAADHVFLGELSPEGQIRPIRGVLPAVLAAVHSGFKHVVVTSANAAEARLVPDAEVTAVDSLAELLALLRDGSRRPERPREDRAVVTAPSDHSAEPEPQVDFADVVGLQQARCALEISAAGGHHAMLLGPPGSGKTMLGERLPTILPKLPRQQALEVTAIYSAAGRLRAEHPLIEDPPFRVLDGTATRAALIGGGPGRGKLANPGEASLAHRGVLFIDNATRASQAMLDGLCQPLESGDVHVTRSSVTTRFPAAFTLLLAGRLNPHHTVDTSCGCTHHHGDIWPTRLPKPVLDRMAMPIRLNPLTNSGQLTSQGYAEPSATIAERVRLARDRAAHRLADTPWRVNAEVPGREIRRTFMPPHEALSGLENAYRRGELGIRAVDTVLRIAWTIADLDGSPCPGRSQIHDALALHRGES